MRILHIWDQAGVAYVLAKYQQLQGNESIVIVTNNYDKYGIKNFYQNYILSVKPEEFVEKYLEKAKSADVIHIHSMIGIVFRIRLKFGKSKKIVLHYHGTDIRSSYNPPKEMSIPKLPSQQTAPLSDLLLHPKRMASRLADLAVRKKQIHMLVHKLVDAVIVATPDLLQFVTSATYIPNPIDTDHFNPSGTTKNVQKEALIMKTEKTDTQWALNYCKSHNISLDIDVYDRGKNPISYGDMPGFLRTYSIYVDIKYVDGSLLQASSLTGLEALASGLKVLDYQLKYHQGLPSKHDPINVVSRLSNIYLK